MTDYSLEIQDLSKFRLPKGFRGRSAVMVQLWWLVQATLFGWSPQFLYGWRRWLLRIFGAKVGQAVLVRPTAKITYPWKVSLGDNVWIGDDVCLYSLGNISIGDNTVISQKSYICAASHEMTSADFRIFSKSIRIGERVWIASDVFVAPGVNIANGVVVGARSSVFGDLPDGMVCLGSPCVPIRPRI